MAWWGELARCGKGRKACKGSKHGVVSELRVTSQARNRKRKSDALGRELREAPQTRLYGHFLAATHRERGPLSLPFTTRVAEGILACSMVFHGVFRPAWASPPFRWEMRPAYRTREPACFAYFYSGYQAPLFMAGADPTAAVFSVAPEKNPARKSRARAESSLRP